MDEQVARIVVGTLLAIAVAAWLAGVRYVAGVRHATKDAEKWNPDPAISSANELEGRVDVAADAWGLAPRLARMLAQSHGSGFGTLKVTQVADDTVEFERAGPQDEGFVRQGIVQFVSDRSRGCAAHYQLQVASGAGWLLAAQLTLLAGIVAIVVTAFLMETYVISNPNPQIRWQSFQTVQLIHLLWPPFMLAARYRNARRQAVSGMEAMLVNLPHLA